MKKNLFVAFLSVVACLTGIQKAFALDEVNGVYQINNAQDLEAFSSLVASGNGGISGVLTANIDMADVAHQPIGTSSSPFIGTFDGQEHFISNMMISLPEQEYVGLFGVLGGGAYIKNVIVDWSCSINGKAFAAGIAGGTKGGGSVTFENCGNEASVGVAEQNAAGICGVSMGSSCGIVMKNCFNTGGISGNRECAALCGWVGDNGSSITNCYNAGFVIGMDGTYSLWRNTRGKGLNNFDTYGYQGSQRISEDEYDLQSGQVAYQLNGNQSENVVWYQRLGDDLHPVPFASHGVVYAVGDLYCDGTSKGGDLTFSNNNESNRDAHQFAEGICSNCGTPDANYLERDAEGFYNIGTAIELNWFAAMVNNGTKKMNARLTADIDFTEYTKKDVMIGGDAYSANESDDARSYEGIFDGQEHKITVNYNVSYDGVALFKVINNSTIRNLMVDGTIESTQRFMGGLGFVSRGTCMFENIVVAVNMTGSYPGDATNGGFLAVCHENPTFSNCAFVGTMNAPDSEGSAAIIGYAHGSVESLIKNCYVASQLLSLTGSSTVIARHVDNVMNCYYTDNIIQLYDDRCTLVSEQALASGELAYNLNKGGATDAWRQTIGEDPYPVPFASHKLVYMNGGLTCIGTPKDDIVYSNTQAESVRDAHQYDANGICTVCGSRTIANGAQLKALADAVNSGEVTSAIEVELTADIDLSGITFEGIGTRFDEETGETTEEGNPITRDVKRPFYGIFNGNGHTISNMLIDTPQHNKGLFGFVSGATIKNVIVDNTCEIYSGGHAAGIVGTTTGRATVTIENCGNEAMVNVGADGVNAAGILGVNDLSEAYVRIVNCYNTGDIVGARECAAISGWLGDHFEVVNCYSSGTVASEAVDGDRTFARYNGNAGTISNCFEVDGRQVKAAAFGDVASGKLCYMLNEGAGETIYYQTLGTDEHPVLDANHAVVSLQGEQYVNGIEAPYNSEFKILNYNPIDLLGRSHDGLQRGINIVRTADGQVKKVLVK